MDTVPIEFDHNAFQIIDGKAIAQNVQKDIAKAVTWLKAQHGVTPRLEVILVGNDTASQIYVRNKQKVMQRIGMQCEIRHYEHTIPQNQILDIIQTLNQDKNVDAILVQMPLSKHINTFAVLDTIHPNKDADGFTPANVARLISGRAGIVPCTPLGCLYLLRAYMPDLSGRNALVIGRSEIVGKPMAHLLLQENCTVTIAHSRTKNLADVVKQADIVVAAVGQAELIKGDWLRPQSVVIDVGINRITDAEGHKKLVGDVDFHAACKIARAVTPVPGGVGPMTITALLVNTLNLCYQNNNLGHKFDLFKRSLIQ